MKRLLFVDNDKEFLETRSELIEQEGYEVIPATDPAEAKRIVDRGNIDLIIIDIRLINDKDPNDTSGLELAKNIDVNIPKIILTRYPDFEAVREALGNNLLGLPTAVNFIAKQEDHEVLNTAIKKALMVESKLNKNLRGISDMLLLDYHEAHKQARGYYVSTLIISITGIVIVFSGILLAIGGWIDIGISSAIVGILAEAISIMFFKRTDIANQRMDKYHSELLETRQFDTLLSACDDILVTDRKEECKRAVIEIATKEWIGR